METKGFQVLLNKEADRIHLYPTL